MTVAFGGILVADGAVAQTVETTGPLTKLSCFTLDSGVRGGDKSIVEDSANDRFKVKAGVYKVDFFLDFTNPATLATYQFHVRVGKNDGSLFPRELSADIVSQVDVPLTTETMASAKASGFLEITPALLDETGYASVAIYLEVSADESSSSSSSSSSSTNSSSSSSFSNSSSSSSSSSNSSSSSSNSSSSSSTSTESSSSSSVIGGPRITVVAGQLNLEKMF